jgi:hypothetical protein
MPFLFENIEDYTELLFPDKMLHTDFILRDLNDIIDPNPAIKSQRCRIKGVK